MSATPSCSLVTVTAAVVLVPCIPASLTSLSCALRRALWADGHASGPESALGSVVSIVRVKARTLGRRARLGPQSAVAPGPEVLAACALADGEDTCGSMSAKVCE